MTDCNCELLLELMGMPRWRHLSSDEPFRQAVADNWRTLHENGIVTLVGSLPDQIKVQWNYDWELWAMFPEFGLMHTRFRRSVLDEILSGVYDGG